MQAAQLHLLASNVMHMTDVCWRSTRDHPFMMSTQTGGGCSARSGQGRGQSQYDVHNEKNQHNINETVFFVSSYK